MVEVDSEKYVVTRTDDYPQTLFEADDELFIWGIKSPTDKSKTPANFLTLNLIEIWKNRSTDRFTLEFNTPIDFTKDETCEFLDYIYHELYKYIIDQVEAVANDMKLPAIEDYSWGVSLTECTLPQLLVNFYIFVKGYKALLHSWNEGETK